MVEIRSQHASERSHSQQDTKSQTEFKNIFERLSKKTDYLDNRATKTIPQMPVGPAPDFSAPPASNRGTKGDDSLTTAGSRGTVRAGRGDDQITIDGAGNQRVNGGRGFDTAILRGGSADYDIRTKGDTTILTREDGSKVRLRNVEELRFAESGQVFVNGQEVIANNDIKDDDDGGPVDDTDTGRTEILGTPEDDNLVGTDGDDFITTQQGKDTIDARGGNDEIVVNGIGDKVIDGGAGSDIVEVKGVPADYTVSKAGDSFVYTSPNNQKITLSNIENVRFNGSGAILPVGELSEPEFQATFNFEPNDLDVETLVINGDTARLTGPDTDFTFTGVDASGLAVDRPIIATGGSGVLNGEDVTAVPLDNGPFSDGAVLTVGSGFNATGTQGVQAAFSNGEELNTTVAKGA